MNPQTLATPAGFMDPALAAPEVNALRNELSHAVQVPRDVATEVPTKEVLEAAPEATGEATREATRLVLHLVKPGGESVDVPLPPAWSGEILHALVALMEGHIVRWEANTDEEIGTGELAGILGVSAPTAVAMLDRGEIPSRVTPRGHRRVRRLDALQWRKKHDAQRQSLRELMQMAERDEVPGPSLPSSVQEDPEDES